MNPDRQRGGEKGGGAEGKETNPEREGRRSIFFLRATLPRLTRLQIPRAAGFTDSEGSTVNLKREGGDKIVLLAARVV